MIFTMLGYDIAAESRTNEGRIDAVIELPDHVYIFEFKLFDTRESALAQIKEKKYYEKYLGCGKKITLVGVAFDAETRNIKDWLIEEVGQ